MDDANGVWPGPIASNMDAPDNQRPTLVFGLSQDHQIDVGTHHHERHDIAFRCLIKKKDLENAHLKTYVIDG
jgi:hypothetical protein